MNPSLAEREVDSSEGLRIRCGKLEVITHDCEGGKFTSVYLDGQPIDFYSIRIHVVKGEKVSVEVSLKV